MKKLFLLLCFVGVSLFRVDAQMELPTIYPDLIISIKPIPKTPPIKPKSLVLSDIEAYYGNETLTLIFNSDLGDADIVVANLTTGDMWNNSVSGVCSTTLILSGDEGYYLISIYTDNGEYSGEFNL